MSDEATPGSAPAVIAGRYRLGRTLGVGGMARVVEAHDERLDRRVAVKLLAGTDVDEVTRRRFLDEARSGARFGHPNAVAVYDAGVDGALLYLVMELVDGPTLGAVIAERGRLDVADAVAVTTQMLAALGAAHAAGLVHRDVKPGNVLFAAGGEVKLADFGIAKRLDGDGLDHTIAGQFIGTPRYLAPEQLAGERATPASDIYAVGVVLFEMLTGRVPFDAEHPLAIALAHRDAPVPDVAAAAPGVPAAIAAAVERAMAKRPADRYSSAAAMAVAVAGAPGSAAAAPSGPSPEQTRASEGVAPTAVAPIATAPVPLSRDLRSDRDRRRWIALAAAAAVVLLALLVRACGGDDSGGVENGSSTSAASSTTPAISAVVTPAPPPAASPTTSGEAAATAPIVTEPTPVSVTPSLTVAATIVESLPPSSVDELIGLLDSDPTAFGDAGSELRTRLQELTDLNGNKAREAAGALVVDVERWRDEGRLDGSFASSTLEVLGPLADGNGNGNGKEDDEDDEDD